MNEILLSDYGRLSYGPSPVGRMMASFASDFRDGIDINLGVGYVNERTIPAKDMLVALREILKQPEKHRLPFNYGGPRGSMNLINSLKDYLVRNNIGGMTEEIMARNDVIIGASGGTSLLAGAGRVLRPGLVITSDPMYYAFCEYLQRSGFRLLAIPEDNDGIRTDMLEERINSLDDNSTNEISFFYIVTVNNPSSTVLSNERRRRIVKIARNVSETIGRRIPVLFDRAYEDLVHDPDVPPLESALCHDTEGIAYEIGTLSKILAPALRIGYMIGRPSAFLDAMVQQVSDTAFSAPLITQEIASWMLDRQITTQVDFVNAEYRRKAVAVRDWIREHMSDDIESCYGGRAGFYYYLTFKTVRTCEGSDFFRFLSRTTGDPSIDGAADNKRPRVVYLPGEYCVHPGGDLVEAGNRQLRLSYAYEELERLGDAIRIMGEAVRYAAR